MAVTSCHSFALQIWLRECIFHQGMVETQLHAEAKLQGSLGNVWLSSLWRLEAMLEDEWVLREPVCSVCHSVLHC